MYEYIYIYIYTHVHICIYDISVGKPLILCMVCLLGVALPVHNTTNKTNTSTNTATNTNNNTNANNTTIIIMTIQMLIIMRSSPLVVC